MFLPGLRSTVAAGGAETFVASLFRFVDAIRVEYPGKEVFRLGRLY